jgi:sugar transferase (PEP-CTERM/EpsH1 system associated)
MNILYLQTDFPYPPIGGGRSRAFYLIKELAKDSSITLVSFAEVDPQTEEKEVMKQYCRDVFVIPFRRHHSLRKLFLSLFTSVPYKVLQYGSKEFADTVTYQFASNKFDLVFSEHPYLAQYIPSKAEFALPQNIELMSTIYERTRRSGNLRMRLYALSQWRKMQNYELELIRRFGVFIAVDRMEQEIIKEKLPNVKTCLVPNGVDVEYFSPSGQHSSSVPSNIVFTGVFSYYPNEQAAVAFSREVLPRIRKHFPKIRFTIVGKNPSEQVRRLAEDPLITVTGYVNDVRPFLENATVVVVPLRIGGGTRLKILEALAMGKPVISTTIGCEGLNVQHGKTILIADTAEEFAVTVVNVLKDTVLAQSLGQEGRRLVEREYRWEVAGDRLREFVKQCVRENSRRSLP